jgi:hypothetical protein
MIWMLSSAVWAWSVVGPERGHVLDVDVGRTEVLLTTRVGVMRSTPTLNTWERDARFPPDTKRVATWKGGAWGAPPTQLWEINALGKRLVQQNPQSVVTDLDAREDGVLFVGWRGRTKGLWRVEPQGEAKQIISDIEPWQIIADGRDVWVATIAKGLWSSEDGQPFEQVSTGSVTSIARVGNEVWMALPTGQIVDVHTQEVVTTVEGGFASHIAELDNGKVLLTVVSPTRQAHPFQVLSDGVLTPITKLDVDEDSGLIGPTGTWKLGDGTALVGTFRRGPLRWDGEMTPARTNFYATVSGGAAMDANGTVAMAFMGTGVYLYQDHKVLAHPTEGPVTDSISVSSVLGQISVVDFEGINLLQPDGTWGQMVGLPHQTGRVNNALKQVGKTDVDTWWGFDYSGRLWSHQNDEWTACSLFGVIRLDGDGEDLVVVTKRGFVSPSCGQVTSKLERPLNTEESRAWGDWIATSEALYYQGQFVQSLPEAKIDSMVADGEGGVLISARQKPLLRCTMTECVEVAPAVEEPLIAVGRLKDTTIWAVEQRGSLLLDDDTDKTPGAWYDFTERRVQFSSFVQLYVNPWLRNPPNVTTKFLRAPSLRFEWWWGLGVIPLMGLLWRRFRS